MLATCIAGLSLCQYIDDQSSLDSPSQSCLLSNSASSVMVLVFVVASDGNFSVVQAAADMNANHENTCRSNGGGDDKKQCDTFD